MDQQVQEAYDPLYEALSGRDYPLAAVFEFIGAAVNINSQLGYAMAYHARDITVEIVEAGDPVKLDDLNWGNILAEIHRRTFFDTQEAEKYGTEWFAANGPEHLKKFSEHIITGLKLEDAAAEHGSGATHEQPKKMQ